MSTRLRHFWRVQTNLREFRYQFRGPAINVVLTDDSAHALHSRVPFLRGHFQCPADHFRHLVDVVRIDHQGVVQFAAGSGELTEDQNAILIFPGRDKLLGHKVHPIMQRGDKTKVRRLVVRLKFTVAVVLAEKNDRPPSFRLQTFIDAVGLCSHLGYKILVAFDVRAAGRPELHKRELLAIVKILLEKPFDSPETLQNAFCVVDAIHADAEKDSLRPQLRQNRAKILAQLGAETIFLGVGVDRIDYTKGILERFRGIECFLEKYLHYREQFTFVQFGAPSRTNIKRYQDFVAEVRAEADRINKRLQSERWRPIVLFSQHHSHSEFEPYYKAADFCLVTSLHDGMNLVAKEFVAAREDEDGVLILSQFTGASRELHDALMVNPYDVNQMAEMIRRALEMPAEERHARMQRMRRVVREHNVYRWAAELISELAEIRLDSPEMAETR